MLNNLIKNTYDNLHLSVNHLIECKTLLKMMIKILLLMTCMTQVFTKSPNILIIVADDLGYGDIGCFGNATLRTPSIDKLASEGVKLTHHLTSSALCTPSRTAMLTGRYQIRSGMVGASRVAVPLFIASSAGLPQSEVTIAELARSKGYNTGLIGKWHLGWSESKYNDNVHHPFSHGFNYYYGHPLTNVRDFYNDGSTVLLAQRPNIFWTALGSIIGIMLPLYLISKKGYVGPKFLYLAFFLLCAGWGYFFFCFFNMILLNSVLYRNFDIVEQPINLETLSERYTNESIEFIQNSTKTTNPFLLVVSWNHVHTALITSKEFRGKSKHGRYGDAVEEMDYGTGRIISSLDQFGISDDTLVYFTSDNGGHLEEIGIYGDIDGGYNGPFKGGKVQPSVDGGIRVPSVVRFGKHIQRNVEINVPTTQMDMFTTISNLIGADLPKDRIIDGKDIMPLLKEAEEVSPHQYLYHYCNQEIQAMRYIPSKGDKVWKLVFKVPNYMPGTTMCKGLGCLCSEAIKLDPPVFYEMTSDPGEENPIPITTNNAYGQLAETMTQALDAHKQSIGNVDIELTTLRLMWNPMLQPCCNFPSCKCSDPKYS